VSRLGNLTLLAGKKNQAQANLSFPEKADAYTGSALLISSRTNIQELWDGQNWAWRVDGIKARQAQLAEHALKVWPNGSHWA
jgi:hypothetical protein